MFSSSSYVMAWVWYLLGCVGLMVVVWRLTRGVRRSELRKLLRLTAAILMVTPYYADPPQGYLAPALIMGLLEGIFEGPEAWSRAGIPLLVALLSGIVLSLLIELIWRRMRQRQVQQRALAQERESLIVESKAAAPTGGGETVAKESGNIAVDKGFTV